MYVPQHFAVTDEAELHAHIAAARVGNLITVNGGVVNATLIPFLLDAESGERGTLIGHIAKANPQWENLDPAFEALVVFSGPDAYVSPSTHPSKRAGGKVVPTWNYVAVHAYGTIRPIHDGQRKREIVAELSEHHERNREDPWAITDAPENYISSILQSIVGIEISLTRIIGKAKLSQNRSEQDRLGVIDDLTTGRFPNDGAVAAYMR